MTLAANVPEDAASGIDASGMAAQAGPTANRASDDPGGELGVVLVVDDHPLNLELIEASLAEVDCTVVTAAGGQHALELVAASPPDLVLLDVMMPGLDGFEVCRRIRASPAGRFLPIVLVTALGMVSDRIQGIEAGADDFITKPIERVELVARVRSLLRVKDLHDRLDDSQRTIFALARAVEAKDYQTNAHTERVGGNSRRVGEAIGLESDVLRNLHWGGIIHDIGKIGIPDAILTKPGPLSVEEYEVMKRHVLIGEEIASALRSLKHLLPIIRNHHERFDGGGYPDGLAGGSIPLGARIVAVCDAFDALSSNRPYRAGLSVSDALAALRAGAGTQWDPAMVDVLTELVAAASVEQVPRDRGAPRSPIAPVLID